jgi:ATP-binding cassette subfamily F protein 3
MALTEALEDFEGAAVIVTHSEEMLRRLATRLIIFQGEAPFLFEGTYDEFLDSIGWEEEEGANPSKGRGKKNKRSDAGDPKRQKAELLQERSRELTPLRNQVGELEKQIGKLESEIAGYEQQIATASTQGEGATIQRLSQELASAKRRLEESLTSWEELERKRSKLEAAFEERLAQFETV